MKWFQQNRALGTLLIVSGVCILLGAALLYWRWSVWGEAKQTFDQATTERNRLQGLDPFPNDANYRKLQGYLERYNAALDKFKDELKAEVAPAPPLAPNEFQSRLRQATLAVEERARTNNVKLPDKFQLVRTLYVHNEKDNGPLHERTAKPTPAPNPQASPGQQGAGALNFIVGNEHIEVSAT